MAGLMKRPRERGSWAIVLDSAPRALVILCAAIGLGVLPTRAAAWSDVAGDAAEESEDDAESPFQNGLIARFTGVDGVPHVRLEDEVSLAGAPPDRRLPPGGWSVQFSGHLQVQASGTYRLRGFGSGAVRLELNGKVLLDASTKAPAWLDAEAIELPFGYHPLVVDYRPPDDGSGRLALYWEGPQFALEPLAGRWLYHATRETPSTAFEDGERLVRALRCAACHEIAGEVAPLPAPALNTMAGNLGRAWLIDWLAQRTPDHRESVDLAVASRRMPHFSFEQSEANAIADYLFANSEPLPPAKEVNPGEPAVKEKKKDKKSQAAPIGVPPVPNREAGATLFRSLGCLACHRVGELGTDNLFGGGNLDRVAEKRPAGYFVGWLADPARLNRNHRMPVFTLNPFELESLALYLQSLGDKPAAVDNGPTSRAEEGRELVEQARCSACHDLPKRGEIAQGRPLRKLDLAALLGRSNCLFEPDAAARRPGYRLSQPLREAVTVFLSENRSGATEALSGKALLAQHSCLSCHARGRARGSNRS